MRSNLKKAIASSSVSSSNANAKINVSLLQPLDVERNPQHPVRVVADEIGLHQPPTDTGGFGVGTTGGGENSSSYVLEFVVGNSHRV